MSRAANTLGAVLSRNAITTRNRDHANHAQNRVVCTPPIVGPSPKSYCIHIPGSVTHGRNTRSRPAFQLRRTRATARRVVRDEPVNPIPSNLS